MTKRRDRIEEGALDKSLQTTYWINGAETNGIRAADKARIECINLDKKRRASGEPTSEQEATVAAGWEAIWPESCDE